MPCTLSQTAQHDLRNGTMALSWALSQLYRSPIFAHHATQKELCLLKDAQDACERMRLALEPCAVHAECERVAEAKGRGEGGA